MRLPDPPAESCVAPAAIATLACSVRSLSCRSRHLGSSSNAACYNEPGNRSHELAVRLKGRYVLGAVNGNIDRAREQLVLDFPAKQALAADLRQPAILHLIAVVGVTTMSMLQANAECDAGRESRARPACTSSSLPRACRCAVLESRQPWTSLRMRRTPSIIRSATKGMLTPMAISALIGTPTDVRAFAA